MEYSSSASHFPENPSTMMQSLSRGLAEVTTTMLMPAASGVCVAMGIMLNPLSTVGAVLLAFAGIGALFALTRLAYTIHRQRKQEQEFFDLRNCYRHNWEILRSLIKHARVMPAAEVEEENLDRNPQPLQNELPANPGDEGHFDLEEGSKARSDSFQTLNSSLLEDGHASDLADDAEIDLDRMPLSRNDSFRTVDSLSEDIQKDGKEASDKPVSAGDRGTSWLSWGMEELSSAANWMFGHGDAN